MNNKNLSILITTFILFLFYQVDLLSECGNVTNCPQKKYSYKFCKWNGTDIVFQNKCVDNPLNSGLDPEWSTVKVGSLPICIGRIIDMPPAVYMSSEKGDNIKIFDPVKAIADLNESVYQWNCLCGRQNDPCNCSIQICFSKDEDIDFNKKYGRDPNHIPGFADYYTNPFCRQLCQEDVPPYPYPSQVVVNNTEDFYDKDIYGNPHQGFVNEGIIEEYEGNIFDDLCGTCSPVDFLQVVVHELGHILGLEHYQDFPCPPYQSSGIMNKYLPSERTGYEGLSLDDVCYFKKLYCPALVPVEEEHQVSDDIKNYPNPLDEFALIEIPVPDGGASVSIKIYNMFNELVNVVDKNYMSSGTHKLKFDASSLPPGVYFCEITIGRIKYVKKMVAYR